MSDAARASDSKEKRPPNLFLRVLRSVAFIYVAVVAIVFVFQRRLQYQPSTDSPKKPPEATEVVLTTSDGVSLNAWHWPAPAGRPTIVIFHGNAGHRGDREYWVIELRKHDVGVFLLDYRGYGGSGGSPTEDGLYADAEAAIAWLESNGVADLMYFGESLGCGVAVEMATRKSPRAVVLHAGYSSAADVGKAVYPFLPVGWLMRDRYDAIEKIERIGCPLMMIHGTADEIIPIEIGRRLFDAAVEPKEWFEIDGAGHNDLTLTVDYQRKIGEFLSP